MKELYNSSFKILAIGNSFSDDALYYLYDIAKSYGIDKVIIANMYIAGASLSLHLKNAISNNKNYEYRKNTNGIWITSPNYSLKDGIKDEPWDVITFQQDSGDSGFAETYTPINELMVYVKKTAKNENVKFAWHMTWAYEQNEKPHIYFVKYEYNQLKMYERIKETVKNVITNNASFSFMIPVGTAIQNTRTSSLGDTLTRDGYHLSLDKGRYIASLTYFKAITGFDITNICFYPRELNIKTFNIIKKAVSQAIEKPLEITIIDL